MAPRTKQDTKPPRTFTGFAPAGEGSIHTSPTWGVDFGDQAFWAESLVATKRRKGKGTFRHEDLENAITGIQITDTIDGSSTIVVKFEDPEWKLVNSGFFDANEDGTLDAIDVNYPAGSDLWWRCTQVSMNASRAGVSVDMTFMERPVAHLMTKKGPKKASRASRTRAEFIKGLVREVKGHPITFHCRQLHDKQKIEAVESDEPGPGQLMPIDAAPADPAYEDPKEKKKGINPDSNVTVKGQKINEDQIETVNICMEEAHKANASERAVWAMITAGIGESSLLATAEEKVYNTHKGVFQSNQIPQFDTAAQAHHFLVGGRSFLAGGAIKMVKDHPEYSVGTVAAKVEISDGSAAYYDGFAGEAKAIIEAYGGAGWDSTSSDGEYRKQYNFEVGGPDHPGENYWEAMVRLKNEVKWALFVDGQHIYYDAETTLIRAKPSAYINRLDEAVVSFSATWDTRGIATEATLELVCDPFEYRAGEVFVLVNFGPASSGSTVKPPLPGRWLVAEIDRDRFDFVSSFRLRQPVRPGAEPAPETASHSMGTGDDGLAPGEVMPGDATDIIKWAEGTVGTTEGSAKHREWASDLGYGTNLPWCSIWIGYGIKHVADLDLPANPAYSGAWLSWSGGERVNTGDIRAGDIVVFDWGDGGNTDHVALYVGGGKVIGGNQSNKVSKVDWNKGATVGVVRPKYDVGGGGSGGSRTPSATSAPKTDPASRTGTTHDLGPDMDWQYPAGV